MVYSFPALAAFRRGQTGAVAVEFALMAIPLCAILLLAVDLHGNDNTFQQIDRAGAAVAASLRDGSTSPGAYALTSARDELLCPRLRALTCASLVVGLSAVGSQDILRATDVTRATWCPGGPQDALLFQVAYPVPFLTRLWAGDLESRKPFFVSSFALRNPPGVLAGAC